MKRRTKPVSKGSPAGKQLRKLRPLIEWIQDEGLMKCYFCGVPIKNLINDATLHHKDKNRENEVHENKAPAHCSCHMEFHKWERRVERNGSD